MMAQPSPSEPMDAVGAPGAVGPASSSHVTQSDKRIREIMEENERLNRLVNAQAMYIGGLRQELEHATQRAPMTPVPALLMMSSPLTPPSGCIDPPGTDPHADKIWNMLSKGLGAVMKKRGDDDGPNIPDIIVTESERTRSPRGLEEDGGHGPPGGSGGGKGRRGKVKDGGFHGNPGGDDTVLTRQETGPLNPLLMTPGDNAHLSDMPKKGSGKHNESKKGSGKCNEGKSIGDSVGAHGAPLQRLQTGLEELNDHMTVIVAPATQNPYLRLEQPTSDAETSEYTYSYTDVTPDCEQ
jgi:hypothetical protein